LNDDDDDDDSRCSAAAASDQLNIQTQNIYQQLIVDQSKCSKSYGIFLLLLMLLVGYVVNE
jgi:hypothetical protein